MKKIILKVTNNQKGIYIILLAAFMSGLLALCGLSIGLGFIFLDNIKFQNTTNAAAMAALNSFLEQNTSQQVPREEPLTINERIDKALSAAKTVFNNNSFYSGKSYVGDTLKYSYHSSKGSTLQFGSWVTDSTNPSGQQCSKGYPCFIEKNPYIEPDLVNSVKITAETSEKDILIAPFVGIAGFLPQGVFSIKKEAYAKAAPKCVSLLLDVSDLTFNDSHEYSLGVDNLTTVEKTTGEITYPQKPGVFAYETNTADGFNCTKSGAPSPTGDDNPTLNAFWCNLIKNPNRKLSSPLHALSDYKQVSSRRGMFYADLKTRPEPLKTYLDSFNGFLQDYSKSVSFLDRIVAYVFDDMESTLTPTGFIDRIPEYGTGENSYPALNETGYLAQLFNIDNIGTVDDSGNYIFDKVPVHPNMLDRGWFPDISNKISGRRSNVPLAIKKVMAEMNSFCSADSHRSIVVASHGVFDKGFKDDGKGSAEVTKIKDFKEYKEFVDQKLIAEGPYKEKDSIWEKSILYDATQWGINLSFILAGNRQQPNFCNKKDSYGKFISLQNMFFAGGSPKFSSLCSDKDVFNLTVDTYPEKSKLPECKEDASSCSYKYIYDSSFNSKDTETNLYFRYPNYYLSQLALRSGGVFCPLLTRAPENLYSYAGIPIEERGFTPEQLTTKDPQYKRVENEPQFWRIENLSDIASGAACLRSTTSATKAYLVK